MEQTFKSSREHTCRLKLLMPPDNNNSQLTHHPHKQTYTPSNVRLLNSLLLLFILFLCNMALVHCWLELPPPTSVKMSGVDIKVYSTENYHYHRRRRSVCLSECAENGWRQQQKASEIINLMLG